MNDKCIADIGFAIAHIRSDEEIVQFFKQLDEHLQPFSTNGAYANYVQDGFERQKNELCNPENNSDEPQF